MSKNILISTLGASWEIIPETIGAFNYSLEHDFYRHAPERVKGIREKFGKDSRIDELWLVSTDQRHVGKVLSVDEILGKIREWNEGMRCVPVVRTWVLNGIGDINSEENAEAFHDLMLKVYAFARVQKEGGKLIASLACGRKTMSADMQDAAYCFGCDLSLHIIQIKPFSFENEIAAANAGLVFPVSLGEYHRNENLDDLLKKNGAFEEFGLIRNSGDNDIVRIDADPKLHFLRDVQERRDNAKYFYSSYYSGNKNKGHSNFPVLYTLTTDARSDLAHCIFGKDPERRADEIKFLHTLPKADLHCHLGGVLDAGELVEVAETLAMEINALAEKNEKLRRWMKDASRPGYDPFAKCDALSPIDWKKWLADQARNLELPKYLMAPALLLCFKNRTEDLDRLIFGDKVKEEQFCGIVRRKAGSATLDFNSYESLGDLQGSSLLKTEKTLRQTVQILLRKAKAQNLRYLEIRCSPMNYVCEDQNGILFSQADVVRVILEELEKEKELKTSLVFIASRHSDLDKIKESIELYHRLEGESVGEIFKKYFRGFDLAGDEQKRSPKDVREEFQEILKDCLNITIHAGEISPAENIWEAVYYLNAERVGHGLTLIDAKPELKNKFLERRIGIEMCPSSNYQIVGFKDNYFPDQVKSVSGENLKSYPLKEYLDSGFRVCVNTDNPGISRTDVTNELLRAARLTRGGLSLWDILQLVYNSFSLAFYPYEEKIKLLESVDDEVGQWIKKNKDWIHKKARDKNNEK